MHKDDRIVVLNKPYGLATQGGSKTHEYVEKYLSGLHETAKDDFKLVHRLDKSTTGLLIIARNKAAAKHISELIKERKIEKKVIILLFTLRTDVLVQCDCDSAIASLERG